MKPQADSERRSSRFPAWTWPLAGLLLVATWFAFERAIRSMVGQWSLEEFSHGYLIPFIALYLAWQRRQLLGLGAAPVYPCLMHETLRRFDPTLARRIVGRQVAFASLGGAMGPAALGLLGAQLGLNAIMPVVVLVLLLLWLLAWRLDQVT